MPRDTTEGYTSISTYKLNIFGLFKNITALSNRSGSLEWSSTLRGEKRITCSMGYSISYSKDVARAINLTYKIVSSGDEHGTAIELINTVCNFGNLRYWFRCNGVKNGIYCGRRVATVYFASNDFYCRHCLDLTYATNNRSKQFRMLDFIFDSEKIYRLNEQLKKTNRYYYANKPAKKSLKLMHLLSENHKQAVLWKKNGGSLL